MDNFYKSSMQVATDGKFKAIVLSGLVSGETISSTNKKVDLRIVKGTDGEHYYEVKVRPLDVTTGLILPDPCSRHWNNEQRLSLIEMHSWARSEFSVSKGAGFPLVAAQEILCYYERGTISNSNFSRLRFEMPKSSVIRLDCLVAFNISTGHSRDLFTGMPITLADYSSVGSLLQSEEEINDDDIVIDEQIPGTILPYDGTKGSITSIAGKRTHPITGESEKEHGGVDVGLGAGEPLYAIAPGVVAVVNRNSGTTTTGFGYRLSIKHTMENYGGQSKTFYVWYGHCQDMLVNKGDTVYQGQVVASCGSRGGSTGPHLHFEYHENSDMGTRKDPMAMLGWYSKVDWDTEALEERWTNTNPDLALGYSPDVTDPDTDLPLTSDTTSEEPGESNTGVSPRE